MNTSNERIIETNRSRFESSIKKLRIMPPIIKIVEKRIVVKIEESQLLSSVLMEFKLIKGKRSPVKVTEHKALIEVQVHNHAQTAAIVQHYALYDALSIHYIRKSSNLTEMLDEHTQILSRDRRMMSSLRVILLVSARK